MAWEKDIPQTSREDILSQLAPFFSRDIPGQGALRLFFGAFSNKFHNLIRHLDICWMNFMTMDNFMQSHKIVAKMTEICETTENLDSNATKLWL